MSNWSNDQFHDERLTQIISDKTKLQEYYDSIDNTRMHIPELTKEFAKELIEGKLECLICRQIIKQEDDIWDCKTCWKIVHYNCIETWIISENTTIKKEEYMYDSEIIWKCPHCNTTWQADSLQEIEGICFCRKNFYFFNNEGQYFPQFELPHGCQSMCKWKICPHIKACPLLCHPGPHIQCKETSCFQCFCGKAIRSFPCSSGKIEFSCNTICCKMYSCNKHYCTRKCHKETCESFLQSAKCDKCFQESKDNLSALIKQKEIKEGINSTINLSLTLIDYIFNGELPCHRHALPLKIEQNKSQLQRIITSGSSTFRQSLLNFIPLCKEQIINSCDCKKNSKYTDCYLLNYNKSLLKFFNIEKETKLPKCNTVCYSYKQCHNHQCLRKCCELSLKSLVSSTPIPDPKGLHICHLKCGKMLNCRKHKCEENCHSGKCSPCTIKITKGVKVCNCGKTIVISPFQCGYEIECCLTCEKRLPCGHYCKEDCHEGDCPQCELTSIRKCVCKKTIITNALCSIADDSLNCANKCGKKLKCKIHFCPLFCHNHDESYDNDYICNFNCQRTLSTCGHTCQLKCHSDLPCDEYACTFPIILKCKCGEIKQMIPCNKLKQHNNSIILECRKECVEVDSLNKIRKSFIGIDNLTSEKILLLYPSFYSENKGNRFIEETPLKYDNTTLTYAMEKIDLVIRIENLLKERFNSIVNMTIEETMMTLSKTKVKIPLKKNDIAPIIDWLVIYHKLRIKNYNKGIIIIDITQMFNQKYRLSLIALLFKHNWVNDNQRNIRKCKVYHPFMFSILLRGQKGYKSVEISVNNITFIQRNDYYLQESKKDEFYLHFFNLHLGKKTYEFIKSKGEYQECFSQEYHYNEGDEIHLEDYLTNQYYFNYLNDGYDEKYYQQTFKPKEETKNDLDDDGFIIINKKKKAK